MSTIDIRTTSSDPVRKITFADYNSAYATQLDISEGYIQFRDSNGDVENDVQFEDIDNLIRALQKVKELKGL